LRTEERFFEDSSVITSQKTCQEEKIIESGLKASKYNYFVKYDEDNFIGYNFLYRSMMRIPADAFPIINELLNPDNNDMDFNQLPPQWLESLQETQFFVRKDIDELALIKHLYFRNLYANDTLSLIVLPTLWCNFTCPYCNEIKRPLFMKPEIEEALIKWVETAFKNKRHIGIAWFGGEPLLAKKTIFRLTEKIRDFCDTIGATYSAALTTNGFYLDEKFIDSLKDLDIKAVHITLDGDKADHDKLRRLRNGSGSFERVFNNIVAFCENSKDCNLELRVNCCDDNYAGIEQLLKRFPRSVIERSQIYFRWVYASEANNYREFSHSAKGSDPYYGLAKLYSAASALGWRTDNPALSFPNAYCEVDYLDHYAISPSGSIFLCSHTFKDSEAIGSLLQKQKFNSEVISKYIKWYSTDPFEDAKCIACQLLPICEGGCRKARSMGQGNCIEEKGNMDLFVKNLAELKLHQQRL
jgi:uncharacterized protein